MAGCGRFRCRIEFWQMFVMCLMGISAISLIISILVLLPGMAEGPDNTHYLNRDECIIKNITYQENLCPRDNSNDVFIMIYHEDWIPCLVPKFEIEPLKSSTNSCIWYYPNHFENEEDGFRDIGKTYQIGTKYSCVIDHLTNICYPDNNEVTVFIVTVSCLSVVFIILTVIYCFIRKKENKLDDMFIRRRKKT